MIVHRETNEPGRPALVATIAGADVVTLATLTALQDDYLLWRALAPQAGEEPDRSADEDSDHPPPTYA